MTSAEKAARLLALHHGPAPLLLPNAWDVASARALEEMGFPAVATSSAAIANGLGYPDGERISQQEMLAAVARTAAAVHVPVTADLEAAYGATAAAMPAFAQALLAAGAVGLNFEDALPDGSALFPLDLQVARIAALRAAATSQGVPLVINARTDAFFLHLPAAFDPFAEAVRRAVAYRAAGADCIFVPGLRDLAVIARLLQSSPGPLNILGGPGVPSVPELARAGVRRISLGSGPYRAALGTLRRLAEELRGPGTFSTIAAGNVPYAEVNAWLAR
ncbi:MAG TPA: isocitrate lyase/phosphoenolpyruvate mutase family protein [Terriglobales bacterium]|nr:isocitrate lyase/phosphoenolpyruvate mutase family protein [Terriglobales bacterium]